MIMIHYFTLTIDFDVIAILYFRNDFSLKVKHWPNGSGPSHLTNNLERISPRTTYRVLVRCLVINVLNLKIISNEIAKSRERYDFQVGFRLNPQLCILHQHTHTGFSKYLYQREVLIERITCLAINLHVGSNYPFFFP